MDVFKYLSQFSTNSVQLIGPMPCEIPNTSGPILYIDGGTKHKKDGLGFSLGDNDSHQEKLDQILPKEKDYSDLSYALSQCHQFNELYLYGFLGGRKDHELINLGEVSHFLNHKTNSFAHFEGQILAYAKGEYEITHNNTFSLFCFNETKITLSGKIKYPLSDEPLKAHSSHGLSNEAQGKFGLKTERPIFLFLHF